RVVQINFNAWHYIDANLWASLATRIFGGLSDFVEQTHRSDERYQRLVAELTAARERFREAERRLDDASQAVARAEGAVATAARPTVQTVSESDPALQDAVETITSGLGLPPDTEIATLKDSVQDLSRLTARVRMGWRGEQSRRTKAAAFAAAV